MPQKMREGFSFLFSPEQMLPMLQMQQMVQDSVLSAYNQQSILSESIMRRQYDMDQASVQAKASAEAVSKTVEGEVKKGERGTTSTYTITYYNPEMHKTEVLEAKTEIRIKDIVSKVIEESVAAASAFPIYHYIGAPIMKTEVLPWKLEEILSQREYGTPPPPPAGAAVAPVKVIVRAEAEIVAQKKKDDAIKAALDKAILRKEKSELRLAQEILILEDTIAALRAGEDIEKVIARLPPLSRARYILVRRRKLLGRQAIISLLLHDAAFLKNVKKKLELFSFDDLLGMYKMLRGLQAKK